MRGRLALFILLAACAPTIDGTKTGSGDGGGDDGSDTPEACAGLVVDDAGLAFTETQIGFEAGGVVTVENPCADTDLEAVIALSAGTATPFALRTDDVLALGPGEAAEVQITFTAPDYAAYEGTLEVRDLTTSGTPTTPVPLFGQAAGDQDGDGSDAIEAGGGDCDDSDAQVLDQAVEQRQDLVDDDCDGLVDEDFLETGDLVVTEVMPKPVSAPDTTGEWFEVTNTTLQDIDLFGWTLRDDTGEAVTLTEHVIVPAEGRAVLGASAVPSDNGSAPVDAAYDRSSFTLADVEDAIYLYAGELLVADVAWSEDWNVRDGRSHELDRDFVDLPSARQARYWCPAGQAYGDGDLGTPGAENRLCPGVDHDGDGYSIATGDCDDTDGTISPGAGEVWDGIDNDCDGAIDQLSDSDASGYVEGDAQDRLTWSTVTSVGDLDDDGVDDLVVGSQSYGYYGAGGGEGVWLISGADLYGLADPAEDFAYAAIESGSTYYDVVASVGPQQGDHDGDGVDDLFLVGSDNTSSYYAGSEGALLFFGGSLSGAYDSDDADVTFSGFEGNYQYNRALSHADLDGDGIAEVVMSDPYNYDYSSGSTYTYQTGRVAVFSGAGLASGDAHDLGDADWYAEGDTNGEALGSALGGGDLDGDGLDDLMLGAPGDDSGGTDAGALWVVSGTASLSGSGTIDDLADQVFTGPGRNDRLGDRVAPQVADFDADGAPDLVVATPGDGEVFVFYDTTALGPTVDVGAADVEIDGDSADYAGSALSVGDYDGDGVDDLLVGAPDTNRGDYNYGIDDEGQAYLFQGATLVGGTTVRTSSADVVITSSNYDAFGIATVSGDFDGDGADEAVIGASLADNQKGRAYLFDLN